MDIDPALLRETLGHYPTGVAVVTAVDAGGGPIGMVVGTFSSVSLDPPLIAFFPMSNSNSFAQLRTASTFCINVLASDQEPLCRQLATGGANKFDGVNWHPGPLGSPIIEDAVSWIECTFEDIREAGDHFIVLGLVHDFAVQRSTLPLLFFQGGYGRFSLGSFTAAPDPDLIQAAQVAESLRPLIEALSTELGVNCTVVAKIRWDSVQVLGINDAPVDDPFPLGHRQPLIPPFGAALMSSAPESEVEEWLGRATDRSAERRAVNTTLLASVRERGYSLLAARAEAFQHHNDVLSEFEQSGGMPRHEREVRQVTSELAELFSVELAPGERYDLASIVVRIPTKPGLPAMALRMTGLPESVPTEQIEDWIADLKRVAATVESS
jgi:flavin reductase (DIM6/NTAB) family NADH-FMN oxidoreductase RutF